MATRPAAAPQGKIVAQMVTTPETEPRLRATIASILPQVDRMVIVFNRYDEVPADILANPAIEAMFTVRALHEGVLPPTINLEQQDPEIPLTVVTEPMKVETSGKLAISNSFGFGGVNAVAAFRGA